MTSVPACFDVFTYQRVSPDGSALWSIDPTESPSGRYLVGPAFFDPQVNGFAGVDFQDPGISREALEHAVSEIHRSGCSHFLLTLITSSPEFLEEQFRRIGGFLEASPHLFETILGFHLEGPFISSEQGYYGAHPGHFTCPPSTALFERWQAASGGRIRMITLAPEWPGSLELIRSLSREGVFVSLGHTNASLETLNEAVNAGARLFTHLGNGSPGTVPRHDNIFQRVLATPGLMASLIPDGIHIPPFTLGNLVRTLGPGRVVFTTDAMSAAGAPPGEYRIGEMTVQVGEDRAVRQPNGGGLAGSSLRAIEGFYNVTRFGGLSADGAWWGWTRLRTLMFPGLEAPRIRVAF
jgi:N-acetylglucosamine-6-phosphate deacetylase